MRFRDVIWRTAEAKTSEFLVFTEAEEGLVKVAMLKKVYKCQVC